MPNKRIWREERQLSSQEIANRQAVLTDIDGVISDASHRQGYLRGEERDWKGFFAACVEDPPISHMANLLDWLNPDLLMVALTARPYWIDEETAKWLNEKGIRWDLLVMRDKSENSLSAKDYKAQAVKGLLDDGFNFVIAFEDDPVNVKVISQTGIPCVYIHSGYYDDTYPRDSHKS